MLRTTRYEAYEAQNHEGGLGIHQDLQGAVEADLRALVRLGETVGR